MLKHHLILHFSQPSNWHIVSQFNRYSAVMGLRHWGFIWINTKIAPWPDLNRHTHTHTDNAHTATLHTDFTVMCFLPQYVLLCMPLLCRDDWLMGLWVPWYWGQSQINCATALRLFTVMVFTWSKTRWNWGLQEMHSPYMLHWTAIALLLKSTIQSNINSIPFDVAYRTQAVHNHISVERI